MSAVIIHGRRCVLDTYRRCYYGTCVICFSCSDDDVLLCVCVHVHVGCSARQEAVGDGGRARAAEVRQVWPAGWGTAQDWCRERCRGILMYTAAMYKLVVNTSRRALLQASCVKALAKCSPDILCAEPRCICMCKSNGIYNWHWKET